MTTLYITGAGVSAQSGIPTFRGSEGFWTIGSKNYTPQEMATRQMYQEKPREFLTWYYHRFARYRDHGANEVHAWLANKKLITQNIDGLDGKAGNDNYIAIHGRLDQVTVFHTQGDDVARQRAPWDDIDETFLAESLLSVFKIGSKGPQLNKSLKPYVLLFDEYYTELYQISLAEQQMQHASKMVFIGTSFSVNITQIALDIARRRGIPIEVVDPEPMHVLYDQVEYFQMTALEYINR